MVREAEARPETPPTPAVQPSAASLARAKWESSGLTDEHADRLKLRPMEAKETGSLFGDRFRTPALYLPYFDLTGDLTKFFRVRFLGPLPGFAGQVEKPQRYIQPGGTLNEVYMPPILDLTWAEIAERPEITIYITEGELKAACACANGLACIGLGGVDVWKSTKRSIPFLPALKEIKWANRPVVIVFDSDAATNPNVVRAQRQLAEALLAEGAQPRIAALPPAKDGGKQGLDDYIVANGVDPLAEVLDAAPPFAEAAALWALNEEVLYVRDPGLVVDRASGQRMTVDAFVRHRYANRHYFAEEMKNGLVILKKKPLPPRWVAWEQRFEVAKITYAPGKARLVEGRWNGWPGWRCEPKEGNVEPWLWLLDHLFKRQTEARDWFQKWLAYPLQNPGAKMYTSAVIWGREKGTGKTLVAYSMEGIYGKNFVEIGNESLRRGFNAWQENRQFVYGDEIAGADSGGKRVDADHLKKLITQREVTINQKFLPEYVIPDTMNYLFTSNQPDAIFLEDGDRRFFVHEVDGGPAPRAKYEEYDRWLNGSTAHSLDGEGPPALFHHLLNLDLTGFSPREHAPFTKAKLSMLLSGKSDIGLWVVGLVEDPKTALAPLGPRAAAECELFTAAQLLHSYDPEGRGKVALPGIGRELKRAGIVQVNAGSPVKTCQGAQRLYAVRNGDRWKDASPKDAGAHFNGYFGENAGRF